MKKEQKGKERKKRDRRRLERRKDRKDRFTGIERRSKNTRRKGDGRENLARADNYREKTEYQDFAPDEDEDEAS